MKKEHLVAIAVVVLLGIVGFVVMTMGGSGDYKEGTYFGAHKYTSYGQEYVTTAVVYVDSKGMIKSVFIDNTYVKEDVHATKKFLGDDYGMKETSANIGVIEGGAEWYEQIELIEEKVLAEQGLDWLEISEEKTTDAITGVTITVDTYHAAVKNALDQAK